MTLAVMLFSIISSFSTAHAQPCGLAKPSWYACKNDSDCLVDFDVCGHLAAYAKVDIEEIRKHHKCAAPDIACVEPPKDLNPAKAKVFCKNKKCELKK